VRRWLNRGRAIRNRAVSSTGTGRWIMVGPRRTKPTGLHFSSPNNRSESFHRQRARQSDVHPQLPIHRLRGTTSRDKAIIPIVGSIARSPLTHLMYVSPVPDVLFSCHEWFVFSSTACRAGAAIRYSPPMYVQYNLRLQNPSYSVGLGDKPRNT
jgi:hypothetical protein